MISPKLEWSRALIWGAIAICSVGPARADDRVFLSLRVDCDVESVMDTGRARIPDGKSNLILLFSRPLEVPGKVTVVQSLDDGRSWIGPAELSELTNTNGQGFAAKLVMPWGAPATIESQEGQGDRATYWSSNILTDGGGSVENRGRCVIRREAKDREEQGQ